MEMDNYMIIGQKFADTLYYLVKSFDEVMGKKFMDTNLGPFLSRHSNVGKWFVVSDYCIEDKTKPHDVASFVLVPIEDNKDIKELKYDILQLASKDLKNIKEQELKDQFCKFYHSGDFFSFNFIISPDNYIYTQLEEFLPIDELLSFFVGEVDKWKKNDPSKNYYNKYIKRLNILKNKMTQKSFNYKLLKRIFLICFIASYIKYLFVKEHKNIKLYSWVRDRDSIESWNRGILEVIYSLISYYIFSLFEIEQLKNELFVHNFGKDLDAFIRIPDYICGTLADYNFEIDDVSSNKQCKFLKEAIANNNYIAIFSFEKNTIKKARISL